MNLTFLQVNTWFGGSAGEESWEFIYSIPADILHLQEVYQSPTSTTRPYNCLTELQQLYPEYYMTKALLKEKVVDGVVQPIGNVTLSRFPILQSKTIYVPGHHGFGFDQYSEKGDHSFAPAHMILSTIDIEGKVVQSGNVHGVWGFDGFDNPRRLEMGRTFHDSINYTQPIILSGDFNTEKTTESVKMIKQDLVDVFPDLKSSFNPKLRGHEKYSQFVVDHLFLSPEFKVQSSEVPQGNISDHRPLLATLEF